MLANTISLSRVGTGWSDWREGVWAELTHGTQFHGSITIICNCKEDNGECPEVCGFTDLS